MTSQDLPRIRDGGQGARDAWGLRSCVPPEIDVRQCDILDLCLVCVRVRQGGERPRRDLEGSKKLYFVSRHDAIFCMAIAVLRRCNFDGRLDFPGTFSKKGLLIQGA